MARKNKMKWYDWIMVVLLVVGGINWGLVGAFRFDLVEYLLGSMSIATRTVYVLVGLSGIGSFMRLLILQIKR